MYTDPVHKSFYASGFLFHVPSQQILLQHSGSLWTLIGGENSFETEVKNKLNINLAKSKIHAIYDYFHTGLKKKHFVTYAEVDDLIENKSFSWFSMKEISKLSLTKETKQDIIVGQRVIESNSRKDAGERTIG